MCPPRLEEDSAFTRAELLEERLDLIFLSPEDATDVVHIALRNCRANHRHPRLLVGSRAFRTCEKSKRDTAARAQARFSDVEITTYEPMRSIAADVQLLTKAGDARSLRADRTIWQSQRVPDRFPLVQSSDCSAHRVRDFTAFFLPEVIGHDDKVGRCCTEQPFDVVHCGVRSHDKVRNRDIYRGRPGVASFIAATLASRP